MLSQYTLAGRTGRGDTVTAAFVIGRRALGLPAEASLELAAAIATAKMQYPEVAAQSSTAS